MKDIKSHIDGTLETVKFAKEKAEYHESLQKILQLGYENVDFIHHFPAFVGKLTLSRMLALHHLYSQTREIAGHIAEIGVYKGASSIFFGKLIQLFEPHSLTMVHGFDNFQGTAAVSENPLQVQGGNLEDETRLRELIRLQGLGSTVKIHVLDAEKDFPTFFEKYPHLRFRLVFIDSGTYAVTAGAIQAFWPRLLPGGVMIFDQFCNEVAPGETRAVCDLLPGKKIQNLFGTWMPSSFVVKN